MRGLVVLVVIGMVVGLLMVLLGRSRSGRGGEELVGVAPSTSASQAAGSTITSQAGVPTRDGTKVISMIASRSDGGAWLLDPDMTSFSVGWAYLPAPGGSGQYWCAILKVG